MDVFFTRCVHVVASEFSPTQFSSVHTSYTTPRCHSKYGGSRHTPKHIAALPLHTHRHTARFGSEHEKHRAKRIHSCFSEPKKNCVRFFIFFLVVRLPYLVPLMYVANVQALLEILLMLISVANFVIRMAFTFVHFSKEKSHSWLNE